MLFAVLLASAILLGAAGEASPAGPSAPPRWFGIAFGTAAVTYRPLLGDPLQITAYSDAATAVERKARFALAAAPRGFLIVTERRGAVVGIEASVDAQPGGPLSAIEADPRGVRLGVTYPEVAAALPAARRSVDATGSVHLQTPAGPRGITADYRFAAGRLVADAWVAAPESDGPQLPGAIPYSEPAADAPTTAILDVQANELSGVAWEYLYLRYHPCDGAIPWRKVLQATSKANGRVYDLLAMRCPTTGTTRSFYFDITSFYRSACPHAASCDVSRFLARGSTLMRCNSARRRISSAAATSAWQVQPHATQRKRLLRRLFASTCRQRPHV
jgi:hypothetical protein